MASKRQKQWIPTIPSEQTAGVAVSLGILYIIVDNLSAIVWAMLSCFAVLIALLAFRRFRMKEENTKIHNRLIELIDQHESALISYYHQSRSEDLFGNCDESRWHQRIDTLLRTQLVPGIENYSIWRQSKIGQRAAEAVDRITAQKIAMHGRSNPLAKIDVFELTPIEYEHHCADMLRGKGWSIQLTPATRDGGADFVAEKANVRIVFQCKRYSHPVGNKAVQEVTSAVQLYNGNVACVVAPSGYTRQAEREATGLSVHLIHHSALPAFADKLAR